jgi:hypothetical protein
MSRVLVLLGVMCLLGAGCGGSPPTNHGTAPSAPPVAGGTQLKKPPMPNKPPLPGKK